MTFLRLTRGHLVAAVAALALLPVMAAVDWSTTQQGEEARRIESIQDEPEPGVAGEVTRDVTEDARIVAEGEERTAFQPGSALDWLMLLSLLATIVLALTAATLRAADRGWGLPIGPSTLTAALGTVATVLVAAFILQVGVVEVGGEVAIGAPVGVVLAGAVVVGSVLAARADRPERESKPVPEVRAPARRAAERS